MNENDFLTRELEKLKIAYNNATIYGRFQGGFLGRIAHEIRSPLGSLMGLHQLIINDLCESPEEEREFIEDAYDYAKKLMAIIDHLINISKLEGGKIEVELSSFNLYQFLLSIQETMTLQANNRNVKLTVVVDDTDLLIVADRLKLFQSICYLLEVAIELSELGGIKINGELGSNSTQVFINLNLPINSSQINDPVTLNNIDFEKETPMDKLPDLSVGAKVTLAHQMVTLMGGQLKIAETTTKSTTLQLCLPTPSMK